MLVEVVDTMRRRAWGPALFALFATISPTEAQDRTGLVVGTVTDDRGTVVRQVEVFARIDGRRIERAVTDAQGRYQMTLPAGAVTVTSPGGVGTIAGEGRQVNVTAGQTTTVDLTLPRQVFDVEGIFISSEGGSGAQRIGAVGGWAGSVSGQQVERNVSVNPTDVVRNEAGVNLVDTGLGSRIVAFRGFSNVFSGAVRYLVDFRKASLPSLRANYMHFVPTAGPDIDRMEMILGPSSAIYGPNSANGVLNVITRSPLDLPESSFSISGGSQSVFQSELRTSQRLGQRVGMKVSARWFQGQEFAYDDPVEQATRNTIDEDPEAYAEQLLAIGVPAEEIPVRMDRIGVRNRDIERWSADARIDWTPTDGDTLMFQGGTTSSSGIELTPLGAAQAGDWRYDYAQVRLHSGPLFAQAFINKSNAGDTYLLRDGAPLIDESQLVGLQARHGFSLAGGIEEITYGADWARTTPRTGGTIHGQFEDEDVITEYGGFIQSRTRLADGLHVTGTLRLDESNVIEDPVFSPRVGVVYEPSEGHTVSASWSRGFSTPTPTNYFLDLSFGPAADPLGALGYRIRARGTGRDGIRFSDGAGGYQGMRSPCTPAEAGGPSALIPATSTNVWQCAVGVLAANGSIDPATAAFLSSLDPGNDVSLNALDPVTESLAPLTPGSVADVAPLAENTTTTMEVGYRGLIGDKLFLQSAVWRTTRRDFASPLLLRTPLVTLNGAELASFLAAQGLSSEQAEAIATGAASVPGGVLSSSDIQGAGAELVATYENFGELSYWGVDLAAELEINRNLSLTATGSWISDDYFEVEGRLIPLNAPELKGSVSLGVDNLGVPLNGDIGVRFHSGFPVSSGDYVGTACLGETGPLVEECVSDAALLDASVGYDGIFSQDLSFRLAVTNLLDSEYRPFVGVPTTGRQVLARMEYRLH